MSERKPPRGKPRTKPRGNPRASPRGTPRGTPRGQDKKPAGRRPPPGVGTAGIWLYGVCGCWRPPKP